MEKILIIEDEASLQKSVGDFLEEKGYSVVKALDGELGLNLAKKEVPNLILLDLVLPKMHGLDVLKTLKADETTQNIPVILFTNSENLQDIEKGIMDGAFAYLVKASYSLEELFLKIKEALKA